MRRGLSAVLVAVVACLLPIPPASAQRTEADVYVAQAVLDIDARRYDEALANLRRALEIEPDNAEALYYLGVTHMALNQPQAALVPLGQARARAPRDVAVTFQLGLAHFVLRDYDRAGPLLEEAFAVDPTLDGLGYYVGFLRYRRRDYQGALAAFRAGRASSPEIQQLTRFYSGLALGVLGQSAQAAAELEQALRLAPGSALTGPAERLRDTIVAARPSDRRFSAELRLGVFYDDNVPVIPNATADEAAVTALRRGDRESFGELVGARADYVWYRGAWLDAAIGYSYFATINNEGDLDAFDIMSHLATVSAVRRLTLGPMPAQAGLEYGWDILFLGGDEFIQRHTATAFGALVEGAAHLTQGFARYQRKEFDDTPALRVEDRDADNWMVGLVHLVRFQRDQHFLKLGYQFDWENTAGRNYRYYGNRLQLGLQYTLPWHHLRLKYDIDVHLRQYAHRNTILPTAAPATVKRDDREVVHVVRGELPLPHHLTLAAEAQLTDNESNLAIFDYTRNVFSLVLSWTY